MGYQAILRKLPTGVLSGSLEDVLTASAVGAVAYGPPAMAQDWLRTCAGVDGASSGLIFEFWPGHHLEDGRDREPDVFITDRASDHLLIVEAKRDSELRAGQLIDEGEAARAGHPGITLHLLTVSDQAVRPRAFRQAEKLRPGLFSTMRHVSWADLYLFLEEWATRPATDDGHQRMLKDALAVLRQFGRDPFRGLQMQEVRAMERDIPWMYALPRELVKLHRGLSRTLEGLHPPLYPVGTTVTTDIVGAVSYNSPERWFPRHFTLRYGEVPKSEGERYFFVRAVLNPPAIWVGYAPRRGDIEALLADPRGAEALVGRAGKAVRLVGVQSRGQPFEVLAGPVEPSLAAIRVMYEDSRVRRLNLIRVFPMTLMARPGADAKLEAPLLGLVKLCRSMPALGAP